MEQKWSSSRTKPRKWPVCTSNKYMETSQGMAWTCRVHWPIATRLERNTLIKNTDLCQAGWRWWENLQSGAGWKDRKHKDCVSNATDILSPEESHLSCSTHSHYVPHSIPQKNRRQMECKTLCFFEEELIAYCYSSCCSSSSWGDHLQKSLMLHRFKLDWDEIWKVCSSSKYASIDRVGF